METSRELIESIGVERVAQALLDAGGPETFEAAMERAKRLRFEPKLPAIWYVVFCDLAGRELPWSLFHAKGVSDTEVAPRDRTQAKAQRG